MSNLLAINAAAGAKSIPKIKRGRVFANEGMVVPDISMPNLAGGDDGIDLSGMVERLGGLGGGGGGTDAITDKAKTKTPFNYAKDALKMATIPARFLLNIKSPKDPLENFADYNMSPTDEVSSAISDYKKQMPDLTPVRVNNKVKGEGLGDLNDIIQKLNNPNQIDPEGFDNSLDDVSFFKPPKEKWMTYGAVI